MERAFVTVVSGLPRSGTSMMMQVLAAGGLPILSDGIREKDPDNPRGYYEYEPVKKTKQDPSWVKLAVGKAVKVIYSLVYELPAGYNYRLIFMQRNMDEVLASQKKMLDRSGRQGAKVSEAELAALFQKQLTDFYKWIAGQAQFSILTVNHRQMLSSTLIECKKIAGFIGEDFDDEAAAAVVSPLLYRNRWK